MSSLKLPSLEAPSTDNDRGGLMQAIQRLMDSTSEGPAWTMAVRIMPVASFHNRGNTVFQAVEGDMQLLPCHLACFASLQHVLSPGVSPRIALTSFMLPDGWHNTA